ncbi:MAG: MarC family protein [Porphyromonas sp.]|nr:MarC family protein [Porphyromonas sp.]
MTNFWDLIVADLSAFNFKDAIGAMMILFVSVDVIGAIPVILSLQDQGQKFNPTKVTMLSGIMFFAFFFIGEAMLRFFGVDINSFAVAGSIVLFVLAVEMIFGVQVFKNDSPSGNADVVPLVFPLFAGAASFTAILTLKSAGHATSIMLFSIIVNIFFIYLVMRFVSLLQKVLGSGGIYILRKFFGVVLLAVSVKFFAENLMKVLGA